MKIKFINLKFEPIPTVIGVSVATLISLGISHWTRFPFWGAFAIIIIAMIANGIVARQEDDMPGGFNNPLPPKNTDDIKRDR